MPRERKPSEWSADQKNHRKCFTGVVKYASRMMRPFIKPIWNKASVGLMSGFNLFVKANKPAFGMDGVMTDPGLLRFSTGPLPLPKNLEAVLSAEQPMVVNVNWINQITNYLRKHDQLMFVLYNGSEPILPVETGFKRKEEHAQIILPEISGNEIFLYLFFRSTDHKLYSNDRAFKIAIP
jgi:hypothetical protein